MVNNLRDLMVDATGNAPDDQFIAAEVLAAGQGRVRRRRLVAGAAVAGVAVTTVVALGTLDLGGTKKAGPVPPVNRIQVEQAGPVLQLSDAVSARQGKDYDVLGTNKVPVDQKSGLSFRAVLEGGEILVADGQPFQTVHRWGFLDRGSPVRWMPTIPDTAQPRRFLGDSAGYVFEGVWDQESLPLWTLRSYDLSWTRVDIDLRPIGPVTAVEGLGFEVGAGKVWGAISPDEGPSKLYSHPLSAEGAWTYVADTGRYAVNDWGLIYIDSDDRVHSRPLGGEQDDILDLPGDEGCVARQVAAGGSLAAVTLTCEDDQGNSEGRTLVLGLDRTLQATVVGTDTVPTPVDVGGDFVVLTDDAVHAVDLQASRVLLLSPHGVSRNTSGRDIFWNELEGDGERQVVAEFH